MSDSMLTTIDNPYNPFKNFREWYAFDEQKGYHTCSYLSRMTKSTIELSEVDEAIAQETAIDEIVALNILGIYKKVKEEDYDMQQTQEVP